MFASTQRLPRLAVAYLIVAAADILGAVVAVATGLAGTERTVISGTQINAPIPFLAVQLAIVTITVLRAGRRLGTLTAALLVALGTISIASGFGDGSYVDSSLTLPERGIQLSIVAATAATVLIAGAQVARGLRRRAVATPSYELLG